MNFNGGDMVRIRSWNSMVNEFGLDEEGDIPLVGVWFFKDMREYCGTVQKISDRSPGNHNLCYLDHMYYIFSKSIFDQSFQNTNGGETV